MGQWFLEWGWAATLLIGAIMFALMLYRSSVASWTQARGDWKVAALMEVGPFITFAAKVGLGVMIFTWATMYIYGAGQGSPIAQSFKNLGSAGVAALGGTFQTYEVSVPDAPSLIDMAKNSIPSETDVRNVLGVPSSGNVESAPQPAPEIAAPANNWVAPAAAAPATNNTWAPASVKDNASGWGNVPAMGPQPKPTQGPALPPPAPTQGPAPKPAEGGWNVSFGGSGGPSAIGADSAVANVGSYTVKGGDSLSKISMTVYGNRSGWARICSANRDKLRDCNNLRSGMVLVIP